MMTRLVLVSSLCVLALALAACDSGSEGVIVARVDTEQPMQPKEIPTEPMGPEAESKTWTCYALSDFRKKTPLVSLTQSGVLGVENVTVGRVVVSGVLKLAVVRGAGLNLRWDFSDLGIGGFADAVRGGVLERHLRYAFVLSPDGTGLYYDFSASEDGTAKPSQIFRCLRS